ncbi:hypothetical protein KI387_006669, partial [Taxus chinensis]
YYAIATKCYIRWDTLSQRLHGNHRFSNTQNPDNTEPWNPNSNGREDSVIQSIPIFSYRELDDFFDCAICLNEFQEGMPCLSPLENGYHVSSSTSINIDLSDQKGKEVAENVFSKSPIISKLTHASSLKDLRTGSQCYWEGNIQRADGMSPPEQRNSLVRNQCRL